MGQELLNVNPKYERQPRVYYLAVASNGQAVIRGSNRDKYTHAVVTCETRIQYPNQLTGGSFHINEKLAERQAKSNRKWQSLRPNNPYYKNLSWEVVSVQKIPAKDARRLKKLNLKEYEVWSKAHTVEVTNQEELVPQ